MAFEEEFGSEISDSEAEKILTVGDAVNLSKEKLLEIDTKRWGNDYIIFSFGAGKTTLVKKLSENQL